MSRKRFTDIRDIAKSLDDVIDILDQPVKKSKPKPSEKIMKALSFNPMKPHLMTDDSSYYNPYRTLQDGSFAPHPEEYWNSQGRDYTDSGIKEFYAAAGATGKEFGLSNVGASFRRSMSHAVEETIQKAAPKGVVHQYEDGHKYKKIGDKHWAPIVGSKAKELKDRKGKGHQDLDSHYDRVERVKATHQRVTAGEKAKADAEAAAKKAATVATSKATKQATKMVKDVLSKFYFGGGDLPTPIKEHLAKYDKAKGKKIVKKDQPKNPRSK